MMIMGRTRIGWMTGQVGCGAGSTDGSHRHRGDFFGGWRQQHHFSWSFADAEATINQQSHPPSGSRAGRAPRISLHRIRNKNQHWRGRPSSAGCLVRMQSRFLITVLPLGNATDETHKEIYTVVQWSFNHLLSGQAFTLPLTTSARHSLHNRGEPVLLASPWWAA